MPSHKLHALVCKAIMRKAYPQVDKMLDLPYVVLGKKHRKVFHDPISAWIVGNFVGGKKGGQAALLHVLLDKVCNDKNVKRLFELYFS